MTDLTSDAELLKQSAKDANAFAEFYTRHEAVLLAYFQSRVLCAHTAADLTAETFAQAFISRKKFKDVGVPARAWLFGIARHQVSAYVQQSVVSDKARKHLGVAPVHLDDDAIEAVERLADLAPMREAVAAALQELSPKLAEAVSLRVVQELPYREVAQRIGCSEGAARVRVTRGITQLTASMEDK